MILRGVRKWHGVLYQRKMNLTKSTEKDLRNLRIGICLISFRYRSLRLKTPFDIIHNDLMRACDIKLESSSGVLQCL